ncbi:MAG TPA: STAS domain-containing protein [Candidatus Krumholzibacteria bacterium]|nr:STAS domain-containing protein [Candidatus Krumholzibacteria bacterium]
MEKLVISEERTGSTLPVAVLTLKGTIETTNASGLEETLARIVDERCFRIVVDLAGVSYISSAGWGIFISEIKRIRRNGGDIKLAAMSPEVREVFELLEFGNILKPFELTADALREFQTGSESGAQGGSGNRRA